MKFWINKESEVDNILILAKNGVLIAECKKEHIADVKEKLTSKAHPSTVFSKDQITKIRFDDITRIVSRNTDNDITIHHKPAKEEKDVDYDFEDDTARAECLKVLSLILPEKFKKTVYQQGPLKAALAPLGSLLFAILASYFYFDLYRWPTIIVGGIWAVASVYMLYRRFNQPPEITRWTIKGKIIGNAWGRVKTVGSYLSLVAIVLGYAWKQPAAYGPSSLLEQMENDELEPAEIEKYISRGADVNFRDENGNAPIHLVIEWNEEGLIPTLIARGADTAALNGNNSTPLVVALEYANETATNHILDSEKAVGSLKNLMGLLIDGGFSLDTIDKLVARGLDIHEKNGNGSNALQLALYRDANKSLIEGLIERGVNSEFSMGDTDIETFLIENGREDLLDLFLVNELEPRS